MSTTATVDLGTSVMPQFRAGNPATAGAEVLIVDEGWYSIRDQFAQVFGRSIVAAVLLGGAKILIGSGLREPTAFLRGAYTFPLGQLGSAGVVNWSSTVVLDEVPASPHVQHSFAQAVQRWAAAGIAAAGTYELAGPRTAEVPEDEGVDAMRRLPLAMGTRHPLEWGGPPSS